MAINFPSLPKLSKKTWIIIFLIMLILAAIPGLALVHFTTSHPFFCLTCHKNQEPPERWLPSRMHPASITCTDCHSQPGAFVGKHFSAGDSLLNENCLRCHPLATVQEQMALDKVRLVKISHKSHAQRKISCLDCHRNIQHDPLNPRTNRPRMETCYHCHEAHPRPQACDFCHPINLVYTKKNP
ncbi:MAG: hypothetical protein ACP5Q3_02710 [bacterium]